MAETSPVRSILSNEGKRAMQNATKWGSLNRELSEAFRSRQDESLFEKWARLGDPIAQEAVSIAARESRQSIVQRVREEITSRKK